MQNGQGSDGRSLAVLTPKGVGFPIFPGLPWTLTLKGLRLIGSQLLGNNEPDALDYFLDSLHRLLQARSLDCVLIDELEVDSPLWAALTRVATAQNIMAYYPGQPQPHWWISFPEKRQDYWQHFSKKTRYNLRRSVRLFEHSVTCVRQEEEVPSFLEQAAIVSSLSWQSKRYNLRVKNNVQEKQLWKTVARLGGLRSYLLKHQGRPVAFVLGLQWKGCFFYEEIGYDPAFAEHSPGTILLFRILEDLLERDTPRLFDFGFGDGAYKQVFANRKTLSGPVLFLRRGMRSRTIIWLNAQRLSLEGLLRKSANGMGLIPWLRRICRRQHTS
jgi:hypothetical protein